MQPEVPSPSIVLACVGVLVLCFDWGLDLSSTWAFSHWDLLPFALTDMLVFVCVADRGLRHRPLRLMVILVVHELCLGFEWPVHQKQLGCAAANLVISTVLQGLLRASGLHRLCIAQEVLIERWFSTQRPEDCGCHLACQYSFLDSGCPWHSHKV